MPCIVRYVHAIQEQKLCNFFFVKRVRQLFRKTTLQKDEDFLKSCLFLFQAKQQLMLNRPMHFFHLRFYLQRVYMYLLSITYNIINRLSHQFLINFANQVVGAFQTVDSCKCQTFLFDVIIISTGEFASLSTSIERASSSILSRIWTHSFFSFRFSDNRDE